MITRLLVIFFAIGILSSCKEKSTLVRVFDDPNGKYKIEVYADKEFKSAPGDAGQGPGEIQLLNKEGDIIHSADIEMVNLIDKVWWSADEVVIKGFGNWSLNPK